MPPSLSSLSPSPPPVPGLRTELVIYSLHPCASRSTPAGLSAAGDPRGEACPAPYSDTRRRPNCRVRGAACSPCLQSRPDPGPLSRSLNGDADPAPPPACSPPHDSDTQNPRHTAAAAALCAPTRPGPARGEGSAGALGEPGGTPRHRCERGATLVAHSLDEVAGALLREALLPAAGQVCGNPRKVVKVGPPRRAPLGGPARPRPARPTGAHLSGSCGPS